MGCWGPGLFANDGAQDWLSAVKKKRNKSFLTNLNTVFDLVIKHRNIGPWNYWLFEEAAAAAEIVAIIARYPPECLFAFDILSGGYRDLMEICSRRPLPSVDLINKALESVAIIREVETSDNPTVEWFEQAKFEAWLANLDNVSSRLMKAKTLLESWEN